MLINSAYIYWVPCMPESVTCSSCVRRLRKKEAAFGDRRSMLLIPLVSYITYNLQQCQSLNEIGILQMTNGNTLSANKAGRNLPHTECALTLSPGLEVGVCVAFRQSCWLRRYATVRNEEM